MNEIIFLEFEDIIEIHDIALKKYGGSPGIRDVNLLLSAIYQPQQTFEGKFLYDSISKMAAIYAYHIAENQPFIDGNKRTAFAASVVFLKLNGYKLSATNEEVYQLFIDLANKKLLKEEFVKWYDERTSVSTNGK
ncbi:MAG: type II toxin-antitoxin system death-on-curing family toxin [bacterium]|nr:MAG: type II toxin-antitoxin system death-on-curing family toxin [bacterium]